MQRTHLKDSSPAAQFVFSLMIVLAGWLVFQLVALLTGSLIFNVSFTEIESTLNRLGDPLSVNYQKYLQFVISLGMFIIAPLIAVYFLSDRMWTFLRADFWPGFTVSMLIALLMVLALPMNNYFTYLNNLLDVGIVSESLQNYFVEKEAQAEKVFEAFLRVSGTLPLIINIVLIALIPAVGEELLFRGVLQNILVRWTKNTFTGVIITSAVFALLHFQFLSVLPRFILGMVLGYIFVWTRSIWMPILAHLVNNAFAVIYYYMMFNGYVGGEMEHVGKPGYAPIYGFLSTLITGVLLYVVWKMMKTRVSQYRHERP